jgi:hypothetical protein
MKLSTSVSETLYHTRLLANMALIAHKMSCHQNPLLHIPFGDLYLLVTKDIMFSFFHDPALVLLELSRGDSSLKYLIEFLQ